ncbi:MAG: ATP-binding protein [Acidobacteria bacterium]|nr:ATP-binding protein [Acidobacteriota bacterium]
MQQPNDTRDNSASLRTRAAASVREDETELLATATPQEVGRLLHDLRVHQIELEMQNEELRRAQGELEASRERYFDLYDLAPVGYLTLTEAGLIVEANFVAANLLGGTRNALATRQIAGYIFPEDAGVYYLHQKQLFLTGQSQTYDLRLARKDGSKICARLEAAKAEDAAGNPVCRLAMSDITEHKRVEGRLLQVQKMESVGLLAGGVAHEFNNLLTVINGYSRLLLDRLSPDDPARSDLEGILLAGERAAELTRRLLAFSRKQLLQPRLIDLNRLVSDSRQLLERMAGKNVEVRTAFRIDAGTVFADPHQLEQVLVSLVLNARDAMPQGGQISIETAAVEREASDAQSHAEAGAGRYVMLAVTDTGMGMDEETRRRVFEPFFTTKDVGKGTGLGLSMAQGIVVQSGGAIEVESKPGHGSTFRVFLPTAEEALERRAGLPRTGNRPER